MKTLSIELQKEYPVPIQTVWEALTDKDQMKHWYFNLPDFQAKIGYQFQFYGGKDEDTQYLHRCEITEILPPFKLSYSWCYDGYKGNSQVCFELSETPMGTLVKLTHSGIESFESHINDFAPSEFEAGWNYIINTSLKNYLED
ncbi:SRPBCC domain-containing protein [Flavobacterium sp. SUN046]|uniref:SRPBCC family protein n=1 Tax=Flavobacterium sp. SUN046 TaxID=3002440 RepID=UPI002DBF1F10|nr:SRPBCC domain-containing protein [Flavobacterium sp. SUN046]MEC4049049.1 SRPBCC domain-containing protein [Flavobacterium sp. SUN046]